MADITVALSLPDPATGVQLKEKYKDMGDGTHARVVSNAAAGGGGGGSGDFVGPASAVNNGLVLFDGTTGKLGKDGGTLPAALAALGGPLTNIVELDAAAILANDVTPVFLLPASAANTVRIPSLFIFVLQRNGGFDPIGAANFQIFFPDDGNNGEIDICAGANLSNFVSGGIGDGNEVWWVYACPISAGKMAQPYFQPASNAILGVQMRTITEPWVIPGSVVTSEIDNGGAGFAVNDTFRIDGQYDGVNLAIAVVDSVDAGAVVTYHFTNAGKGYIPTEGAACTATSGGGTGLTLNILTVDAITDNNYKLKVATVYNVIGGTFP